MLGKLMKHEWKASWKIYGLINLYMVIITILGAITAVLVVQQEEPGVLATTFAIGTFILYYVSLLGVSMAPNLYSATRFYKNLYSNEGYLMHTLPVGKHSLILSKLLVAVGWMNITLLMEVISIGTVILSVIAVLDTHFEAWDAMREFGTFFAEAQEAFATPLWLIFVVGILVYVIGTFSGTLLFYACISLGQLAKKHKIVVSIGVYIGIQSIMQMFSSMLQFPLMILMENIDVDKVTPDGMLWGILGFTVVFSLVLIAAYYAITYVVMKKKVNLD